MWDLLSWFDDVEWTTTEGRDWHEVRDSISVELSEMFHQLGFPNTSEGRGWTRVSSPLLAYRRVLSAPDVLAGRWRYVPRLSDAADHGALRTCARCQDTGLSNSASPLRPQACACVRRFDPGAGTVRL